VSWGWLVIVSSYTVVFIYESWSYLIEQSFLALIAFLCWCAAKQSINQSSINQSINQSIWHIRTLVSATAMKSWFGSSGTQCLANISVMRPIAPAPTIRRLALPINRRQPHIGLSYIYCGRLNKVYMNDSRQNCTKLSQRSVSWFHPHTHTISCFSAPFLFLSVPWKLELYTATCIVPCGTGINFGCFDHHLKVWPLLKRHINCNRTSRASALTARIPRVVVCASGCISHTWPSHSRTL